MTKKHENTLTDKQKKALPFFLNSKSHEDGCRNAGVSKHAFYEWLQNPEFKKELSRLQEEVVQSAVDTLKSNMTHATDVLVSLLDRKDNPSLQRNVANDILGHVAKFKELHELEKRLEALEQKTDH